MISAAVEKVDVSTPRRPQGSMDSDRETRTLAPFSAPNGKRSIVAAVGAAAADKIVRVLHQHAWVSLVDIAHVLGVSTKTVTWFWRDAGGGRRARGYCRYYPVGLLRLPNGRPDMSEAALAMRVKLVRDLLAPELPLHWSPSPRRPRITGTHGWRTHTGY